MEQNREVIRQFGWVSLAEVVCVGLMLAVYGLLGDFSGKVLFGALLGAALAIGNFLLLSLAVVRAIDRAAQTDEAAKATISIRSSALFRLLVIAGTLILALKAGVCEPLPALLPLIFMQLCIRGIGFFRKDGAT